MSTQPSPEQVVMAVTRKYRPFFGPRTWAWMPRRDGQFLRVLVLDGNGRRYEWWPCDASKEKS